MNTTVAIPVQVRLAAVSTVDKEARTAELVWTTGAAVKRYGWQEGEYFEELSLDKSAVRLGRLNGGAPLLNTHDSYDLESIIGVVEKAWMTKTEGRATVRFSRRADVEPFWNDVQDGIIRNVSVGYMVHKFQDITPSDEKVKRLLAVDWEPFEVSLVPIGADANAGVRSEQPKTNPCEIEVSEERSASVPPIEVDSDAVQPLANSLTAMRGRSQFVYSNPI